MKKVNLLVLFKALGYNKGNINKTQKTLFLKKHLGFEDAEAKRTVMVELPVAQKILATFVAAKETAAQVSRSTIAATINIKDEKYYVEADEAPATKIAPAETTALKNKIKELEAKVADLEDRLSEYEDIDEDSDDEDELEDDETEDEEDNEE